MTEDHPQPAFDPFGSASAPHGEEGRLRASAALREILTHPPGELRGIRGNLLSAAGNQSVRSVLFTSCYSGEGRTHTAVAAALALAAEGEGRILLADASFASPQIHELFGISREPGLGEFLADPEMGLHRVIRTTNVENVDVVPSGANGMPNIEAFQANQLERKLALLREEYAFVVFDGSPAYGFSDVFLIAAHFDGIVLVVECERTKWEVAQLVKERVEKVGGRILGVVLNKRKYYVPAFLYSKT